MNFHCSSCGYEVQLNHVPAPGQLCPVCQIGTMVPGQLASGFSIHNPGYQMVVRNPQIRPGVAVRHGRMLVAQSFNYFTGEVGTTFEKFVRANSCYAGKCTNILIPEPKRFAWLTPYTGNKHNRAYLTQLILAKVAKAKFVDNQGRLPRLIEPFLGSGQVFLNACHWSSTFNNGGPLFAGVLGGDLNHYVIGAYRSIQHLGMTFVNQYKYYAAHWDTTMAASFPGLAADLQQGGLAACLNHVAAPSIAQAMVFRYIWLVNRCLRGSKLSAQGGLMCTLNPAAPARAAAIRAREEQTLTAVVTLLQGIAFDFDCRDFRVTTAQATPSDIVFMDCPFPKFSRLIPPNGTAHPETYGTETASTYGTGDDGAAFQTAIVTEALRLVSQGTTVILCNFANPGLINAYQAMIGNGVAAQNLKSFTYTYRSPATMSEAYQLTILPGANNPAVTQVPPTILNAWLQAGGDDYTQEDFFVRHPEWTTEDQQYLNKYWRKEQRYRELDQEAVFDVEDDEEYDDSSMEDDSAALVDGVDTEQSSDSEDDAHVMMRDDDGEWRP